MRFWARTASRSMWRSWRKSTARTATPRIPCRSWSAGRYRASTVRFIARPPGGRKVGGFSIIVQLHPRGRITFTLGHEFGHYLIHRFAYPDGIRCGEQDVVRWNSEYGQIEYQANVFSAGLLMPLDDFRRHIAEG